MSEIILIKDKDRLKDALRIRYEAFVIEGGVRPELERDSLDNTKSEAEHFAIAESGKIVGTIRAIKEENIVHLGRFAIEKEKRGMGYGRMLINEVENFYREKGFKRIYLNAQLNALGFYKKMGYRPLGEEFEEAGIMHIRVEKAL